MGFTEERSWSSRCTYWVIHSLPVFFHQCRQEPSSVATVSWQIPFQSKKSVQRREPDLCFSLEKPSEMKLGENVKIASRIHDICASQEMQDFRLGDDELNNHLSITDISGPHNRLFHMQICPARVHLPHRDCYIWGLILSCDLTASHTVMDA